MSVPEFVPNVIAGTECPAVDGETFENLNPATGASLGAVARSKGADVDRAIGAACDAQAGWAATNIVQRGNLLRDVAQRMGERKEEIAAIVAAESGKIRSHAMGEADAAIEMGFFVAGEGRRYYGRTTTASMDHRSVMTVRQPLGVAALITASNTPIANVAWKAFPSMLCGNASVMKPSEDTPATAWIFADICREVGIPPGVFNVVQGLGAEAGPPLVEDARVDLVSFTGGHKTGSWIQKVAGERLAKVCLELGGKNALVVCDDADLDHAEQWVLASSFSNAGQRCAASSRIIVFDAIYDAFVGRLVQAAGELKLGTGDDDYLGPVINERQLNNMLSAVQDATDAGGRILVGGERATDSGLADGFYMRPTLIDGVSPDDPISQSELFGPVAVVYRVADLEEAIAVANNSNFGLTSCIHTGNVHRAMQYANRVEAGVVVVNGGTHGSEPHMGFGGLKNSGNGWREAGVEALDVYSDWKYINIITDPGQC